MVKAIRIHKTGGPDVLTWEDVEVGRPGPGEALIRHTAVGLNFIDIYHRSGRYPVPLPAILGMEGAGLVEAVGPGETEFTPGMRVVYLGPMGAYAQSRLVPTHRLVRIPAELSDQQAAAVMLKGLTAHCLLRRVFRVQAGDTILVHAAAGGVGLILCQWATHLGVNVIGTVGSEAKAALARAHGCQHTILYKQEDFVARVRELTGGKGVPVVYDSVGADTFMRSLDCLKPMGLMVSYGQSSGHVPPLDVTVLSQKGSLFLTRPTVMTYVAQREELLKACDELFDQVCKGRIRVEVNQVYSLQNVAQAHADLESRKTTGSTVLLPL